jgi:chemotaxis signal transduction protein
MSTPFDETSLAATTQDGRIATERAVPSAADGRYAHLEHMLQRLQDTDLPEEPPSDKQFLLFTCGGILCAAPLINFREVLPVLPQPTALPFSPPWALGICILHAELIGLVDPAPMLLGQPDIPILRWRSPASPTLGGIQPLPQKDPLGGVHAGHALVVGEGERSLAFAVQAVLDIVASDDDEIVALDAPAHPSLGCAEAYAAGFLLPKDVTESFTIVRVDVLLADLLAALEDKEAKVTVHD